MAGAWSNTCMFSASQFSVSASVFASLSLAGAGLGGDGDELLVMGAIRICRALLHCCISLFLPPCSWPSSCLTGRCAAAMCAQGKKSVRTFHIFLNETKEPVDLFWWVGIHACCAVL